MPKFPCLLRSRSQGPSEPCAPHRGSRPLTAAPVPSQGFPSPHITACSGRAPLPGPERALRPSQGLPSPHITAFIGAGPAPSGVCAAAVPRCPSVPPGGAPAAPPPALVAAPRGARCVVMHAALTSPLASLLTIVFIYLFARLFICSINYLFVSASEPLPAIAPLLLGSGPACGGGLGGERAKIRAESATMRKARGDLVLIVLPPALPRGAGIGCAGTQRSSPRGKGEKDGAPRE